MERYKTAINYFQNYFQLSQKLQQEIESKNLDLLNRENCISTLTVFKTQNEESFISYSMPRNFGQTSKLLSNLEYFGCSFINPKGCGGGPKVPGGQEIVSHFSQGYAMVTKILDFNHKHPN